MNPFVEAILFLLRQAELSSDPSVHADAKRLAAQVRIEAGMSRQAAPNPEPPGSEVEPVDDVLLENYIKPALEAGEKGGE